MRRADRYFAEEWADILGKPSPDVVALRRSDERPRVAICVPDSGVRGSGTLSGRQKSPKTKKARGNRATVRVKLGLAALREWLDSIKEEIRYDANRGVRIPLAAASSVVDDAGEDGKLVLSTSRLCALADRLEGEPFGEPFVSVRDRICAARDRWLERMEDKKRKKSRRVRP